MSTLKDRIVEDMKAAMRSKDSQRLGTIRMLLAMMKQKEVDERVQLDDAMVISLVDKAIKQRKDAISAYSQAQRQDLVDQETMELRVLEDYLPARLDYPAIEEAVRKIVEETGASSPSDMGKVMAAAKEQLAQQAQMALVSQAVKKILSAAPAA